MDKEQYFKEHANLKKKLDSLADELERQIQDQLELSSIKIAFPIASRVKTIDSIDEKIASKRFNVKKSITEFQDLVGLRIISLHKSSGADIDQAIKTLFPKCKQFSIKDKLGHDKFGYSSIHYIIEVPESWSTIPHLRTYVGIKFEIQVRTISEHIWAECSAFLNYKAQENIPPFIERPLNRLSAVLEIVDSELDSIKNQHAEYINRIRELEIKELLTEDLNPTTLKQLMSIIFSDLNENIDEIYALLNTDIERDYNIFKMPHLFSLIEKYRAEIQYSSENNHSEVLYLILECYKRNGHS